MLVLKNLGVQMIFIDNATNLKKECITYKIFYKFVNDAKMFRK